MKGVPASKTVGNLWFRAGVPKLGYMYTFAYLTFKVSNRWEKIC